MKVQLSGKGGDMQEETCPYAYTRAIEAAGGRDNLTERELQLIDMGVRAGIQSAQELIAEKLRERDE
ncbi:hypothetical protein GCM10023317_91440 [Actinopolymorpha pittospori]